MEQTKMFSDYMLRYDKLNVVISLTNNHIINNDEPLFYDNANFYTKAYLIMQCVYLESYIKEVLKYYIDEINKRINDIKLPYNLIKWIFSPKNLIKENDRKNIDFIIDVSIKDIDGHISANPYRTKDLLEHFGFCLDENETFHRNKEKINAIVTKRNNIVHYNDDSSDVSNADLLDNIVIIKEYMGCIDQLICSNLSQE